MDPGNSVTSQPLAGLRGDTTVGCTDSGTHGGLTANTAVAAAGRPLRSITSMDCGKIPEVLQPVAYACALKQAPGMVVQELACVAKATAAAVSGQRSALLVAQS